MKIWLARNCATPGSGAGVDDKPTTDLSDISGATNYVNLALKQAMGRQAGGNACDASVRLFGKVFGLSAPFPSPLATCCRSFRKGRRVHGPRH